MTWTYQQTTGILKHDGVLISKRGYSGVKGSQFQHNKQNVKDKGPIPVGKYTLIGGPFKHHKTGVYTIRLLPDPKNEMFGRDGFMLHGDSGDHPGEASHGCIVFPKNIRKNVWESGDHEIEVIE